MLSSQILGKRFSEFPTGVEPTTFQNTGWTLSPLSPKLSRATTYCTGNPRDKRVCFAPEKLYPILPILITVLVKRLFFSCFYVCRLAVRPILLLCTGVSTFFLKCRGQTRVKEKVDPVTAGTVFPLRVLSSVWFCH